MDGAELVFSSGIRYTITEAIELSRKGTRDEDLRVVHLIKRIFDGVVLSSKPARVTIRHGRNFEGYV